MKSLIVPHFLNARSKEELQKLVLSYQAKKGGAVAIKSIYQEQDGTYTCWFLDDLAWSVTGVVPK